MSKTIQIHDGLITLIESKAVCPHCKKQIPFDEIEKKWGNQESFYIKMKCKCKKRIGITTKINGDFVAFEL